MPVSVLASFVLASVGAPFLPQWAGPLAVAQARKPRPVTEDMTTDVEAHTPPKIKRSQTVSSTPSRPRRRRDEQRNVSATIMSDAASTTRPRSLQGVFSAQRPGSAGTGRMSPSRTSSRLDMLDPDAQVSSSSLPLPETHSPRGNGRPATPKSAGHRPIRRHTQERASATAASLSLEQKSRLLRQNYFRCQTQFLSALEGISSRLVVVPKAARLSALRAELALIAQDLPAEVDIPLICPATLVDGVPSNSKHHRIVRLNPAECTVLNSAEKVPYLLMVEILRDDFTFNPSTPENESLLQTLMLEQGASRRRIFDLSEAARTAQEQAKTIVQPTDSVFEPSQGDLGNSPLIGSFDDDLNVSNRRTTNQLPRLSSGATTLSTLSSLPTPRSSGASGSRSSSPSSRKTTQPTGLRSAALDQPDFSALATHMRAASHMLAQLELTSGKRPKGEVAAIRAKIIASMNSLDEQSFDSSEPTSANFDVIMANANAAAEQADPEDMEAAETLNGPMSSEAGATRMENDLKTGGIQRKDADDPSRANFGEAWSLKKMRIRKASPYGWMKNWDLISVIVKTGDDLRQEAFAVQLISVCERIWERAEIPVWVKRMRILVTGESSGLIETITNGVSLHSLKRSLTLETIEAGQNSKGRIATLKDHFVKTFGLPESDTYKAAEDAFRKSLAAYSIISYILQLKDRHNGNILIDNEGHIIHIDFGFMLSNSPGSVGFEAAPFKLTQDYVDVLGGPGSESFGIYKSLCKQAFQGMFDIQIESRAERQ